MYWIPQSSLWDIFAVFSLLQCFTVNLAWLTRQDKWPFSCSRVNRSWQCGWEGLSAGNPSGLSCNLSWNTPHFLFSSHGLRPPSKYSPQMHAIGWCWRNITIGEGQKPVHAAHCGHSNLKIWHWGGEDEKEKDKWKGRLDLASKQMAFSNFASPFLSLFFTHFPAEWRPPNISAQTLSTKLPHKEGPQPGGEREYCLTTKPHYINNNSWSQYRIWREYCVWGNALHWGGVYFVEIKVTKPS